MKKLNLRKEVNGDVFQVISEVKEVYIGFIDHDGDWRPRNESQKNELNYSAETIFKNLK